MPELEPKLRDAFLSYSSEDRALVSRVNDILQHKGLETFFDRTDIRPGSNWIDELNEKLASSRVTVVFFTQSALKSGWVKFESQKALKQAIEDKTRHIVPVLLHGVTGADLPGFLNLQQALDLSRKDLSNADVIKEIGEELARHIHSLLPEAGLPIPFVVFAMNRAEAEALVSGDALSDASDRERIKFEKFIENLDYDKDDIPSHYVETRDEWRPPFCLPGHEKTIRQMIAEVVGLINESIREEMSDGPVVYPQYFSDDFLSDDERRRLNTYEFLKKRRFVLVIDSLSLFHPELNRRFMQESSFGQSSYKTVRIVVPFPRRELIMPVGHEIEQAMRAMMLSLYDRFDTHLDTLYEFGVFNERALRRWLFSSLERELIKGAIWGGKAEPKAVKKFRSELSNQSP